ncbi:MAG TPA: hypothetical protein VFJ14_01740 [Nocardioidaceae bacterium]|nr:hypothetical protein [Nocardioidaceae bacterium]
MTAVLLALAAVIAAHTAALCWRAWAVEHARREAEQSHYDRLRALLGDWL